MPIDIKGINLVDRFNKFFEGSAEIKINVTLEHLWAMAERPAHQQRKVKAYKVSVTVYFDAIRYQRLEFIRFLMINYSRVVESYSQAV